MKMSQSADEAEGLQRREPKMHQIVSGLSCSLPSCTYTTHMQIQACNYLSEVTGKDGMIYQTGRQAVSTELLLDGTERYKGE